MTFFKYLHLHALPPPHPQNTHEGVSESLGMSAKLSITEANRGEEVYGIINTGVNSY